MPPLVQAEEYFAELLGIAGSESLHSNRLQPVELLLATKYKYLERIMLIDGGGVRRCQRCR